MTDPSRSAFYALRPGGWRDYVTLLHLPYTLWHLSYVVVGAALAPLWLPGRLGVALAAFALALGIGAHALDELHDRPLGTRIPSPVLWVLAIVSVAGAVAVGIIAAVAWWPWLALFVASGGFIVVAYNLELFDGRFHSDVWFALSWGSLPLLAANAVAAERVTDTGVVAAGFAGLLSLAQRRLSTPVRMMRRAVTHVSGTLETDDGHSVPLTREVLTGPSEDALRLMAAAAVALAVALVLLRVG